MRCEAIDRENVNRLLDSHQREVDLLSIDIDMNDYWVWEGLEVIRPRVVVIEYNALIRPPIAKVVPYNPTISWSGGSYFGASLCALQSLGERKGYCLVGCNLTGVNAFFVRRDLVQDRFMEPFTAETHYAAQNTICSEIALAIIQVMLVTTKTLVWRGCSRSASY